MTRKAKTIWLPVVLSGLSWLVASPGITEEPYISEFLAVNASGLEDEDGDNPDWIEVHNPGPQAVGLAGWALTDDPITRRWLFPDVTLDADGYLVVFASGKNRDPPGGELHTNFRLDGQGEYLALLDPGGNVVHEFTPSFPRQREDVSYGLRVDLDLEERFFPAPTPGEPNGPGVFGFVADTKFSVDRGFYEEPFEVEITTETPGATIYYTTDGSSPSEGAGAVYDRPLRIDTTTVLRAAAFRDGFSPTNVDTHTYIFTADVIRQTGVEFPRTWGGTRADYAMDPNVVDDPRYREEIEDDLKSIPTLSIVMDEDDLFDPRRGIYANTAGRGEAWERPASIELIRTDGVEGFQVNCGLRIFGYGWRPHSASLKHAFRVLFRRRYGPAKLEYPLFRGSPVESFENIVFRSQGSRSWNDFRFPDIEQAQYIRDTWARDTARAMGKLTTPAAYVHLYLNGLYWGLYNPVERPDAAFMAEHLGGDASEYDALNARSANIEVIDGDRRAWDAMIRIARAGLSSDTAYARIQQYVDVPDLIDYFLINQYGTNRDWPGTNGNNMRAARKREPGAGFKFFCWDMEYTFWGVHDNNINVDVPNTTAEVYARLRSHPEFRMLYADHAHRHLFNDGALTPRRAAARWEARATEIYGAIVCESARWGDRRREPPYTRDVEWARERQRLIDTYFPLRTGILIGQLQSAGLYPRLGAPLFSQHGGPIEEGFSLSMSLPAGTTGTIYYTVDTSDPRLPGGAVSPAALEYTTRAELVAEGNPVRILAPTDDSLGSTWTGADQAFDDSGWTEGRGGVGYDAVSGGGTVSLQTATASFSQTGFFDLTVDQLIDGVDRGTNGWGVQSDDGAVAATAVFEAEEIITGVAGAELVFEMVFDSDFVRHNLGKFRLAVTAASRSLFADGRPENGDVGDPGIWTVLSPTRVESAAGNTFSVDVDGTVLATGDNPNFDTYTVAATSPLATITGCRLEVLKDESLPGSGPGLAGSGNFVMSEFGFEVLSYSPLIQTDVEDAMRPRNATLFMRFPFEVAAPATVGSPLVLEMRYDDGFVAFLNGREVARANAPPTVRWDSSATAERPKDRGLVSESFPLGTPLEFLRAGANVLAIHGLNDSAASADFLILPELRAAGGPLIPLARTTHVRARTLSDGEWSALNEATFIQDASSLRITEIMYHPLDASDAGPFDREDFEFVELQNTGSEPLNLAGVRFTAGIDFTFPEALGREADLAPGEVVLVVSHLAAFASRYATAELYIAGEYEGNLDNAGERITLVDGLERTILDFVFDDTWYPPTDGDGFSLEIVDPLQPPESWSEKTSWRAGPILGTPGEGVFARAGWQLPGDLNQDGRLDVSDVSALLTHLLVMPMARPCDGDTNDGEGSRALLDVNGDGKVNLTDAIHALRFLFVDGPPPALGSDCVRIPDCPDVCQ